MRLLIKDYKDNTTVVCEATWVTWGSDYRKDKILEDLEEPPTNTNFSKSGYILFIDSDGEEYYVANVNPYDAEKYMETLLKEGYLDLTKNAFDDYIWLY